jgi:ribonuclease J
MKYDRKVTILGRSMLNLAGIARELGYMTFPDGLLVPIDQIKQLPHDKIVILTTGSQGEPLSALTRIANDEHKQVKIVPGDTVVLSATPIPGNERSVANTINALFLRGADVIYGRDSGVHVSGHACREEQKLMINLCQPKFFMPIHGEYRMLVKHCELATECGVEAENTFVLENGDVLEITKEKGRKAGRVKSGIVLIDSSRSWQINDAIVEERRHLAEDGLVVLAITIDQNYKILGDPEVSIKGVILPRGLTTEEFVLKVQLEVRSILASDKLVGTFPARDLRSYLVGALDRYFQEKMRAKPLVQVLLHSLDKSDTGSKPREQPRPVPVVEKRQPTSE